jgi:hypothetical protein
MRVRRSVDEGRRTVVRREHWVYATGVLSRNEFVGVIGFALPQPLPPLLSKRMREGRRNPLSRNLFGEEVGEGSG